MINLINHGTEAKLSSRSLTSFTSKPLPVQLPKVHLLSGEKGRGLRLFHCHLDNETLALVIRMALLAAVDYGTAHLVTYCVESQSK